MALGAYPDVSLAQPRDGVTQARKILAAGNDPMTIRKADKVATFVSAPGISAHRLSAFVPHLRHLH